MICEENLLLSPCQMLTMTLSNLFLLFLCFFFLHKYFFILSISIFSKLRLTRSLSKLFRVQGYPTLMLMKNNQVYRFKGHRDEKTLKDFIFKNYSKFEATLVPTELPTFFENMKEAASQIVTVIFEIYNSDNTTAKVILSFLFGVIFVLVSAVCYFVCCDSVSEMPKKRVSTRQSSGSQRQSTSTEDSRLSTPATENGNVKKRSTARRRE